MTEKVANERRTAGDIDRLIALDVDLRKSMRLAWSTLVWALVFALIASSQHPHEDDFGTPEGSGVGFAIFIVIAVLMAVAGLRRLLRTWNSKISTPEAKYARMWAAAAGPIVVTTVLRGGPRLGIDLPISGETAVSTAWGAAGHNALSVGDPVTGLGVLAVASVVNGISYLRNAPQRAREQAALTARYQAESRARLSSMLASYTNGHASRERKRRALISFTRCALESLPSTEAVSTTKRPSPGRR